MTPKGNLDLDKGPDRALRNHAPRTEHYFITSETLGERERERERERRESERERMYEECSAAYAGPEDVEATAEVSGASKV